MRSAVAFARWLSGDYVAIAVVSVRAARGGRTGDRAG